jgi:hypothetical protein
MSHMAMLSAWATDSSSDHTEPAASAPAPSSGGARGDRILLELSGQQHRGRRPCHELLQAKTRQNTVAASGTMSISARQGAWCRYMSQRPSTNQSTTRIAMATSWIWVAERRRSMCVICMDKESGEAAARRRSNCCLK